VHARDRILAERQNPRPSTPASLYSESLSNPPRLARRVSDPLRAVGGIVRSSRVSYVMDSRWRSSCRARPVTCGKRCSIDSIPGNVPGSTSTDRARTVYASCQTLLMFSPI